MSRNWSHDCSTRQALVTPCGRASKLNRAAQAQDVFRHLLLLLSDKAQYARVTTWWQRYKLTSEWKREIACFTGEIQTEG
ncbi:hypothetical protein NQZ68_003880 [Dissostichus eleginoides]|nr:hypothetical protein NQZ68_003880 [Dissostichus eleginoides]